MEPTRAIAVISMPGDRLDEDIAAFGKLSAETFDELVIREDTNTRGRPSGEIAARLKDAAMTAGLADEAVTIVLEEIDAVKVAVERSDREDLVVLMVDKPAQTWAELNSLAGAFSLG
jgi:cyanophycin synthetase